MTHLEGNGKQVLICDGERRIVRLVQVNLERQGYTVTPAYVGRAAIALLERESFNLAVVGRDLPDMDGRDLVGWIRAHEWTKELRVVLLGEGDDDEPGGPSGLGPFITKSFNPMDIL